MIGCGTKRCATAVRSGDEVDDCCRECEVGCEPSTNLSLMKTLMNQHPSFRVVDESDVRDDGRKRSVV